MVCPLAVHAATYTDHPVFSLRLSRTDQCTKPTPAAGRLRSYDVHAGTASQDSNSRRAHRRAANQSTTRVALPAGACWRSAVLSQTKPAGERLFQ